MPSQPKRIRDSCVSDAGLLVVFSGPSGVGKDTVLEELSRIHAGFRRCVTATTRPPREDETDGEDYHFISEQEFRGRIDRGGFLEWANVHGSLYGTPRKWVEGRLRENTDVILKIDVQGAAHVRRAMPEAVLVFLAPPSMQELENRLRGRESETEQEAATRLANAISELEQMPDYDYVIENDTVANAADRLRAIIIAEHCRIR